MDKGFQKALDTTFARIKAKKKVLIGFWPPKEQRLSMDKALSNGWSPIEVIDGVVLMAHPNLESNLQLFADGSYTRVKRVTS